MEFCPGCGKKSKTICNDCKPISKLKIKEISVKICSDCKKYFYKNKWTPFNKLDQAIKIIVKDSIKQKGKFDITPFIKEIKLNPGIQEEFEIEISDEDDVFLITGFIEVTYCNNCSKQQGDYFEGVLQLRKITKKMIEHIRSYCKQNNIFIPKETKQPNGIDLTITDKKRIQNLGQNLQKNFGGILKISPKIHTKDRQTSKDVYRVNVYYEAPDYLIGEVIKAENKLVLITKITKIISGIDLLSWKKISINVQDKEYTVLKPKKTTVSKLKPHLEVLDPNTFQSVPVANNKKVEIGEKVKVVDDGRIYIL